MQLSVARPMSSSALAGISFHTAGKRDAPAPRGALSVSAGEGEKSVKLKTYKVKPGDSLYAISVKHKVRRTAHNPNRIHRSIRTCDTSSVGASVPCVGAVICDVMGGVSRSRRGC
jgi:hypothetical protein